MSDEQDRDALKLADAAKEVTAQPEPKPEGRPYDGPPPAGLYNGAAHETARTQADAMNRDLADVTRELAKTAGVLGTSEHAAFQQAQAMRGDEITRAEDPVKRAELRAERDAVAHIYTAGLAERIGSVLEHSGQGREADAFKQLADTHREIAGILRGGEGGDKTPPEGPGHPDGPGSSPDRAEKVEATKRDFAEAAKNAGREVLGKTAEVVMTADGPTRPKESNLTQNQAVQMVPTVTGTQMRTGPQNRFSREVEPEPLRPGELSRAPIGRVDEGAAERGRDASSRRQAAEEGRGTGDKSQSAMQRLEARLDRAAKEIERESEDGPAMSGPERPSGQGAGRVAGRYAALTR